MAELKIKAGGVKKIVFKKEVSPKNTRWEELVSFLLSGGYIRDVNFFKRDGELQIPIDDAWNLIVLKEDGTWRME